MGKLLAAAVLCAAGALSLASRLEAGGGSCNQAGEEAAGDTVALKLSCFSPAVLRVEPGVRVTWLNGDTYHHNIVAAGRAWGTQGAGADLPAGASFSHVFSESGVFPYACSLHAGMAGAIVVGEVDAATAEGRLHHPPVLPAGSALAAPTSDVRSWPGKALAGAAALGGVAGAAGLAIVRAVRGRRRASG